MILKSVKYKRNLGCFGLDVSKEGFCTDYVSTYVCGDGLYG